MPDRNENQPDETDPAILVDRESIHTTAIGIVGGTAQVDVALPPADDEDDYDDDVVDDEVVDAYPIDEAHSETDGRDARDGEATPGHGFSDGDADHGAGHHGAGDHGAADHDHDGHNAGDHDDDRHDAATDHTGPDGTADHAGSDDAVPNAAENQGEQSAVEPVSVDSRGADDGSAAADIVDAEVVEAPAAASDVVIATVVPTATVITTSIPTTRREAHHAAEAERHATERVQVVRPEPVLQSRRLGDLEPGRESSDLLTAERLLDPAQVVRAEPEGRWQRFVYAVSGHRINLGDGKRARGRKELDRRISAPLTGGAKFVPVLSRKGGVGKTTITTLLGMALADARDDRVIAIDANPDRGTLADRIGRTSGKTVRDLVRVRADVVGFNDLSSIVARDETRLDVLASDTDPHVSEAFSDRDYQDVASIAAHYYSIVLTDTGTGIVHSVMGATLDMSDQLVVVAGMSVDEARLASETLTWLESNGFADQVKGAVVVLNTSRPGTPMVRASELQTHFRTRVRTVLQVPYDPHLAAGSAVTFRDLEPATREAARELAASVVEGLRLLAPAA